MADKMIRRVESDATVYGRDLNRFLDVILGNSPGRISLLDDGGNELDLFDGTVLSSNNYSFKSRSAAGRHGFFQHSAGVLKALDIQDAGITTDVPFTANGNVTLGDASGDTLTVNATATFKNNVTLGETSGDTLTVESTAQFKAAVSFDSNVTLGNATTDVITITGTLPIGSASAPSLKVGESNTGLYLPSASVLGFTIAGTERARLSASDLLLTGVSPTLTNTQAWRIQDSGGTAQSVLTLSGSDVVTVGYSGAVQTDVDGAIVRLRAGTTTRIRVDGTGIGFFGATAIAKPTVSGSRGGNAALADLCTELENLGLITDSTT